MFDEYVMALLTWLTGKKYGHELRALVIMTVF